MALRLTLHDAIMSLGLETHQALEGGSTGSRSNLNAVAAVFIGLLDDDGDFIAMVCGWLRVQGADVPLYRLGDVVDRGCDVDQSHAL